MKLYLFVGFLFFLSCTSRIKTDDIILLEGYWVISEATAPNGEKRTFNSTVEVDFFELEGEKGFRKKVTPLLDDSFNSTNDLVGFTISFENESCIVSYSRKHHSWKEEILLITNEKLKLKDSRGVVFEYKRFVL